MTAAVEGRRALLQAAEAARYAPSIHNTQPWRWVVRPDRLELYANTERQLTAHDPDGHMLLLSCGAALHHAEVALSAEGWRFTVDRPGQAPLAVIRPSEHGHVTPEAMREFQQLHARYTDRRTVSGTPIEGAVLDTLVRVAERAGVRFHVLRRDQVIDLAVAVEHAEKAQTADEKLQQETAAWIGGDRTGGTGIPAANLPEELPLTTVAERDFGVHGTLPAGAGHDTAATYAVFYGTGDEPADWLRAGEALNAVWLSATEHGAALLPLSSPVEVPFTRRELGRIIGGVGYPYLVVRLGTLEADHHGPERTPRLPVDQIVDVVD